MRAQRKMSSNEDIVRSLTRPEEALIISVVKGAKQTPWNSMTRLLRVSPPSHSFYSNAFE